MIAAVAQSPKRAWNRFAVPPLEDDLERWHELDEKLPADHLARQIDQRVDALDFSPLIASYKFSGSPPLRPDLMLKMVLFFYQRGIQSPAQWSVLTEENYAVQWIGRGVQPSRTVWYEFAQRIAPFIDQWNREILFESQQQDLVSNQGGSLDGSTVAAAATRHRLLTLDHIKKRLLLLEQVIVKDQISQPLLDMPYWMGNTPRGRLIQKQRYRKARGALGKLHAENELKIPSIRKSPDKIRLSVSDPEAPLGLDKHKVYRPLYNVQLLRDVGSPFILGYDTYARSSDSGTLVPMLNRTAWLTGTPISTLLADSGYITGLDLADAARYSVDLYGPWKSNDYSAVKKDESVNARITKDDFKWDEESSTYQCPQGEALTRRGRQLKKRSLGRTEAIDLYRADKKTCQACALKPRCCPKSRSGRNLNRSEHEDLIEAHKKNGAARVETVLQAAGPDSRIVNRRCERAP